MIQSLHEIWARLWKLLGVDLPLSSFATWLQLNLSILGDFQVLVNFVSWFQFMCLIQLHGHTRF
jgi:hypothetical protein